MMPNPLPNHLVDVEIFYRFSENYDQLVVQQESGSGCHVFLGYIRRIDFMSTKTFGFIFLGPRVSELKKIGQKWPPICNLLLLVTEIWQKRINVKDILM